MRGWRTTVWDLLGWWGRECLEMEILEEHPDLEAGAFPEVCRFAAEMGRWSLSG